MTTATATAMSGAEQHLATGLLVPVDLSPQSWQVLPVARALASRLGVKASPVHVDVTNRSRQDVTVRPVIAHVEVCGAPTTVQIVSGVSVVEALEVEMSHRPGAIVVMATHGRSGVGWLVRGNLCRELLDRTDAPLIAVGPRFAPRRHTDIRRVLVCLDPIAPDCRLVEDCAAWAAALQVPLSVLSVQTSPANPGANVVGSLEALLGGLVPDVTVASVEVVGTDDPRVAIVQCADRVAGTLLGLAPGAGGEPSIATRSVTMHVAREGYTAMLLRACHDD